jgi:hypothetical protein
MRAVARQVSLARLVRVSLAVVSLLLASTLHVRPGQAAERAYTFEVVALPLHFPLQGQTRDDIVRFTDLNNQGTLVGIDFAGDSFLITPNQ